MTMEFINFLPSNLVSNTKAHLHQSFHLTHQGVEGYYYQECLDWLQKEFEIKNITFTNSNVAAWDQAFTLLDCEKGDEVILSAFITEEVTHVLKKHGIKPVFVDVDPQSLNITEHFDKLIQANTKAIVINQASGIPAKMNEIIALAHQHNIQVIEDAHFGFGAYYGNKSVGLIGDIGIFSFENFTQINVGRGGALMLNTKELLSKSKSHDIYLSQQTFYQPSDIMFALLYEHFETFNEDSKQLVRLWHAYKNELHDLELEHDINLPFVPGNTHLNGARFHFVCNDKDERDQLIHYLATQRIKVVKAVPLFHQHYDELDINVSLPVTETYHQLLIFLPIYPALTHHSQRRIISAIKDFYAQDKQSLVSLDMSFK